MPPRAEAELEHRHLLAVAQRLLERLADDGLVLRMDRVEEVVRRVRSFVGQREHRPAIGGQPQPRRHRVPPPQPGIGRRGGDLHRRPRTGAAGSAVRRRSSISAANSSSGRRRRRRGRPAATRRRSIRRARRNGPCWRSAWIAIPAAMASSARRCRRPRTAPSPTAAAGAARGIPRASARDRRPHRTRPALTREQRRRRPARSRGAAAGRRRRGPVSRRCAASTSSGGIVIVGKKPGDHPLSPRKPQVVGPAGCEMHARGSRASITAGTAMPATRMNLSTEATLVERRVGRDRPAHGHQRRRGRDARDRRAIWVETRPSGAPGMNAAAIRKCVGMTAAPRTTTARGGSNRSTRSGTLAPAR